MRARDFYDLVSGRRRGLMATLLRSVLTLIEGPYRLVVAWRNRQYDTQADKVHHLEVPVVSVGNLTLGGTGKTPMVKWLARWFREADLRVTLLSRGYGTEEGVMNDEAMELEDALPDVPHLQNPDRVASGQIAIEELEAELLILDDGFQHRRLGRDLDIVLLDATEPFGFGHIFPRGALREPIGSLKRANVVCLTRSNLISATERNAIRERVVQQFPHAVWCESISEPIGLLSVDAKGQATEIEPIDSLAKEAIVAFCGLGNPEAFRQTLVGMGIKVSQMLEFPDHHAYTAADVNSIGESAKQNKAKTILCTHKDLVKVRVTEIMNSQLKAVVIGAKIVAGQQALESKLKEVVELTKNSASETI